MKKIIKIILVASMICLLTACSSDGDYSYGDSYSQGMVSNSVSKGISFDGISYKSSADYSDTYINGSLADYSYNFKASGVIKDKETALNEYENIQQLVESKGGYIKDVRNTYYGYDITPDDFDYSSKEIRNKATGCVSFTVEVDNSNIDEVINELDKFIKDHKMTLSVYSQVITNYVDYNVVEDRSELYDRETITREELDKRLKYAELYVSLSYRIKRPVAQAVYMGTVTFVSNVLRAFGQLLVILISVAIVWFSVLFLIIIPSYKLFVKSVFKFKTKHSMYFLPKEVINSDSEMQNIIQERATLYSEYIKNKKKNKNKKGEVQQ